MSISKCTCIAENVMVVGGFTKFPKLSTKTNATEAINTVGLSRETLKRNGDAEFSGRDAVSNCIERRGLGSASFTNIEIELADPRVAPETEVILTVMLTGPV